MMGFEIVPFIKSAGYFGIFAMIVLENGIPLLFFLPGDTLLLTAGFIAAQGYLDIKILVIGGFIMAISGYMLGYYLGKKVTKRIFENGDTRYIKLEHLEKTKEFYNKYGALSLFLARFLPFRACVCFLAGASEMRYSTFMFYNVTSAIAWAIFLPLIGYFLGSLIPIHDLKMIALLPLAGIVGSIILFVIILHLKKHKSGTQVPKEQKPKE